LTTQDTKLTKELEDRPLLK